MTRRFSTGWAAMAAFVAASLMVPGPLAEARERLRERIAERMAERMGADAGAKVAGSETIAYGRDPLQTLDIWRAKGAAGPAPVSYTHLDVYKRQVPARAGYI